MSMPKRRFDEAAVYEDDFARAHARLVAYCLDRNWREDPEDPTRPETVQAMQIALHIPKNNPPLRHDLLAAAAQAVVGVCLDERAGQDGAFWEGIRNWYGHRIRKIARRARNSGWNNVQVLAGVTVSHGTASARAFVPSAVEAVDPLIGKLQIGNTDVPAVDYADIPVREVPTLYVDVALSMSAGKAAAQVGHASMLLAAHMSLEEARAWAATGFDLQVRGVDAATFKEICAQPGAVAVQDAGFTEVAPDSITVCALPAPWEKP